MKLFLRCLFILPFLFTGDLKAQSLYMTASPDWVSVGDLDVTGDQLTVEALIYYTGASVNIVSKHTNPSDVNYLLRIGSFEITTTSGFAAFSGAAASGVTISPNKMYHVAATYDGAMLKYYVNGCLTGEMPWTGDMVQTNLITAIGQMSTCQCEQFLGYIDEVRIWNVARTQTEIATNMTNLPSPTTQPGLLGYWKFDGNYINAQGNPTFDGTPVNAPLLQQAPLPYPVTLTESLTSSDPICSGEANGLINVSALGYYSPYEYSLDGITYGGSPVFPGLTAGTYTVYTRPQGNSGCAVSSTITLTDPPVLLPNLNTADVTCNAASDGSASVAPSGGDGPTYEQLWHPSLNTTTSLSGLSAGSYSVDVSDTCKASGPELVTNGHFDDGLAGFTTGYTCCAGGPGNYAVDVDPNYYNGGHFGNGLGGAGNYLIVDGSTVAGTSFWCQTIAVSPNTYYSFSTFIASNYTSSLAVVDISINGTSIGTVNAPAALYTWDPFQTVWYSGASTSATICMTDQNVIGGGNDFGIDNISFKTCLSCTINTPFTISDPPLLTNNVSATPSSFCLGDSTTINSVIAGGTGAYTYTWNIGSGSSQLVQPLITTNYILTATDANNCTAIDSILITVFQPGTINLGNDTAICSGDILLLDAGTGFVSYEWQDETVTQTLNAEVTDEFFVVATDANGCTASDTMNLVVNPLPVIGLNDSLGICPGLAATLTANPGYTSYAWNSGAITSSISTTVGGNNVVTVQDANGCVNMDSTFVIIYPVPTLSFIVAPLNGCSPLDITTMNTSALNGSVIQSWNWTVGPNSFNDFDPSFTLTNSGQYNLLLEATTSNGCLVDTLLTNYIEVYPTPVAIVSPEFYEYELTDDNILITDLSQGATIYNWSLAGVPVSNLADLIYPVTDTGQFVFHLIVMNQFGCMDSLDVTITVNPDFAIFFPNAFTPNSNGYNDHFMPKGYGINEFEMLIFDRWGELVFRSNDLYTGWDGTYKGNLPFTDVYVYKCRIRDIKGDSHYYYGHVTVVR